MQQPGMGEVGGLRFTAVTRLCSQRLQGFELVLHGGQWPTTGQPELLGLILPLQPLLQIPLPPPWG